MRNYLHRWLASGLKVFFILFCVLSGAETWAQGTPLTKCFADKDGDGFGDPNDYILVQEAFGCGLASTRVTNDFDCNDNDRDINPNTLWYKDADNDGLPSTDPPLQQCTRPQGYKLTDEFPTLNTFSCTGGYFVRQTLQNKFDCDDLFPNPSSSVSLWYLDNDKDGSPADLNHYFFSCAPPNDGQNYLRSVGFDFCNLKQDCNDNDPLSYPDQEWYLDGDGDGYPLNNTPEFVQCERPAGGSSFYKAKSQLISLSEDCDDTDPAIYPGTWYEDKDSDGLITGNYVFACAKPEGYIFLPNGGGLIDCDDNDKRATIVQHWYPDADGDGHGGAGITACKGPDGWFTFGELKSTNDCNDNNNKIYPGALEICNGVDDDCDGLVDETYCCPSGNILYVKANAAGANNGTSWANAFTRLQDALETANRCTIVTEIWVAGGTYYPDEGGTATSNNAFSAFVPRGGLAIYGGFTGTETLLSQRNLAGPKSILSGEIQQDGTLTNNAIHILILDNITTGFVLDGFTIRDGYSNIVLPENNGRGIGILVANSSNAVQVRNCIITQNSGTYGVAITNVSSSPRYVNCVITGNTTFTANGAVWNDNASPTFVNCTIADNAITGSDFIVIRNTGTSSPAIYNSIVRGTSPAMDGGTPVVTNSLIQNPTVWPGTGNSNADPLFVNEGAGDLHLQATSPAINTGDNSFNTEEKDIEGNPRKVGGIIDMGAYESPHGCSDPYQWVIDNDNDHYYTGDPLAACTYPGAPYVLKTDHQPGDCNDDDPVINPATIWYKDADGDGYNNTLFITQPSCTPPGTGYTTSTKGPDCNDGDATLNPETIWYRDADGDGYNNTLFITQPSCTSPGAGYSRTTKGADCNDGDAAINPETIWYKDADGDGYSDASYISRPSCTSPGGSEFKLAVKGGGDCNDGDASINPETVWYLDADNDGYYTGSGLTQCQVFLPGYKKSGLLGGGDCNDGDAAINPGTTWYLDADGDGYHSTLYVGQPSCTPPQGTGFKTTTKGPDCNDNSAAQNPETVWILDADGDGYYSGSYTGCLGTQGYVIRSNQLAGDCNDSNPAINPSKAEICGNSIDESCDGQADEGCNNKPLLNINSVTVYEAPGVQAQLTVSLTRKVDKAVTVSYTTSDGTARSKANKNAPADYKAASGVLTIPAGSLSVSLNISIANDGVTEVPETFTVVLSKPVNVAIGTGIGTVTILDPVLTQSKAVDVEPEVVSSLAVQAFPNPSTHRFSLVIKSGSDQPLSFQVVDMLGRVVEARRNLAATGTYYLGDRYRPGVYQVQVVQGEQKQTLRLVKRPD